VAVRAPHDALRDLRLDRRHTMPKGEPGDVVALVVEVVEVEDDRIGFTAQFARMLAEKLVQVGTVAVSPRPPAPHAFDAFIVARAAPRQRWQVQWFKPEQSAPAKLACRPPAMAVGAHHIALLNLAEDFFYRLSGYRVELEQLIRSVTVIEIHDVIRILNATVGARARFHLPQIFTPLFICTHASVNVLTFVSPVVALSQFLPALATVCQPYAG
jgi:hypothetical protein